MLELQISAPSGVDPSSMPASVLPDEPGTTSADIWNAMIDRPGSVVRMQAL